MNIFHLSDTHNLHRQLTHLPEADVVVHSGDFTIGGTENEVTDFINWFCDLPYRHKIFIAGNHDDCLYEANISGLDKNCYYLYHSSICIQGINFHGIPMFVEDIIIGKDRKYIQSIPQETDVLITHQPPFGILDFDSNRHYGDADLLRKVKQIKSKLHLFGHIHSAHGIEKQKGTTFSNAALINEHYNQLQDLTFSLLTI